MTSDSGARAPEPPRADLSMPGVVDIRIRRTTFTPRPLRHFASSLPASDDAIEFIVATDGPIPVRALGAALYVGGVPVTEVEEIGKNTYRFIAPERGNLARDAAIHLGWTGQPPPPEQ